MIGNTVKKIGYLGILVLTIVSCKGQKVSLEPDGLGSKLAIPKTPGFDNNLGVEFTDDHAPLDVLADAHLVQGNSLASCSKDRFLCTIKVTAIDPDVKRTTSKQLQLTPFMAKKVAGMGLNSGHSLTFLLKRATRDEDAPLISGIILGRRAYVQDPTSMGLQGEAAILEVFTDTLRISDYARNNQNHIVYSMGHEGAPATKYRVTEALHNFIKEHDQGILNGENSFEIYYSVQHIFALSYARGTKLLWVKP